MSDNIINNIDLAKISQTVQNVRTINQLLENL